MAIYDLFKKNKKVETKTPPQPSQIRQATVPEHLINGELPWGWVAKHRDFIEQITSEHRHFSEEWYCSIKKSPKEQYAALKSFIIFMNDAVKMCHQKGVCYEFYYINCVITPEYIAERTADLSKLEENLDQKQQAYLEKQAALEGLEEKVIEALKQNDGILQSQFLKTFNPIVKDDVSYMLYCWADEGKLERIKSGRSYILHLK